MTFFSDEKKDEGTEKTDQCDDAGVEPAPIAEPAKEQSSLLPPTGQLTQLTTGVATVGTLEVDSSVPSQLPQSQMEPPNLGAICQQPTVTDPTAATMG